ncbi:UPF0149 family protein [Pseudoalteromonas mariniglutinosa]|uniref:UPF0149 family protein n=1 Tax=Pseudoalteromonas mariniglutinosa TaxID=206042 RepID=UPI00384CC4A8
MQVLQFSSQQSELLVSYLDGQDNALSLTQTQGYLFAVICAPEPLDVHQWLEQISPGCDGQMDEEVLFAFMALYQQISEQVFETGYKLPANLQRTNANTTQQYPDTHECQQWSKGFLYGANGYIEKLLVAPQLAADLKDALLSAQHNLGFFVLPHAQLVELAKQHEIPEDTLCQQQYEVMGDFALGFAELIEIVSVNSGLYNDEGWNES